MTTEKLSWAMRDALRLIRVEMGQLATVGNEQPFVRPSPSIPTPTLEALERRGLVELRYNRRAWKFDARLTDAGREVAG